MSLNLTGAVPLAISFTLEVKRCSLTLCGDMPYCCIYFFKLFFMFDLFTCDGLVFHPGSIPTSCLGSTMTLTEHI